MVSGREVAKGRVQLSFTTMSVSLNIWNSSPSISILLPPNSGSSTLSPTPTLMRGMVSPISALAPGPTATTTPSRPLVWAFSGIRSPPLVLVSEAALWTRSYFVYKLISNQFRTGMRTRSNSGMIRLATPDTTDMMVIWPSLFRAFYFSGLMLVDRQEIFTTWHKTIKLWLNPGPVTLNKQNKSPEFNHGWNSHILRMVKDDYESVFLVWINVRTALWKMIPPPPACNSEVGKDDLDSHTDAHGDKGSTVCSSSRSNSHHDSLLDLSLSLLRDQKPSLSFGLGWKQSKIYLLLQPFSRGIYSSNLPRRGGNK